MMCECFAPSRQWAMRLFTIQLYSNEYVFRWLNGICEKVRAIVSVRAYLSWYLLNNWWREWLFGAAFAFHLPLSNALSSSRRTPYPFHCLLFIFFVGTWCAGHATSLFWWDYCYRKSFRPEGWTENPFNHFINLEFDFICFFVRMALTQLGFI